MAVRDGHRAGCYDDQGKLECTCGLEASDLAAAESAADHLTDRQEAHDY